MPSQHEKFEAAIARIERFCKKLKDEIDTKSSLTEANPPPVSNRPAYFFGRKELGTIELAGTDIDELGDSLFDLYEAIPVDRDSISLRTVESAIHESMLKSLLPNERSAPMSFDDRLTLEMTELRKKLRQARSSWRVQLPVSGLDPTELPRKVGAIEFYNQTHTATQQLESVELIVRPVTTVHVRIQVETIDPEAAKELGIRELRQTFDLLNYFGSAAGNRDARVYFPWDARAFPLQVEIIKAEESKSEWTHHEWRGPWIPFSLNLLFDTPRAKQSGFQRAVEILSKSNKSTLEDRIITAIQWAGRATVEERREEAFVLFAIALESLLVNSKEKDQITQRFAMRGAHLIGRDFLSRKKIYGQLKKLYDLRSRIVHSGSTEIADADRDVIAHLVRQAIHAVLMSETFRRMERVEDFHIWFENKSLGWDDATSASANEAEQRS